MIHQSSVVPVQVRNDRLRILIISNLNQTRWIVPKGIVEHGLTPAQSAVKEAMEEAGVAGVILPQSLGTYAYRKWNDTCHVELFVLRVTHIYDNWEEDKFRKRRWIDWEEFIEVVDGRIPRSLLHKLPPMVNPLNDP